MHIKIPYTYTESWIPPRCRKHRDRQVEAFIKLTIREVTGEEAPVAVIQRGKAHLRRGGEEGVTTTYRWYDKRLWVIDSFQRSCGAPYETQTAEQFAADPYGMTLPYYHAYRSRQENRVALMQTSRDTLIIDGIRYCPIGEPRYVIYTFGLGHNHGGTSLSVDHHYNSNLSKHRYFRIDQREIAEAEVRRTAEVRGDDENLTIADDVFDILIPEAIRLCPAKEHGDGDPFMNRAEKVISGCPDQTTAGLGLLCILSQSMGK